MNEDPWSDIDLALRIVPAASPIEVAARWAAALYDVYDVAHHVDIVAGGILYRVFLLGNSLQIDISFWPDGQFRATEPRFELVFGTANPATSPAQLDPDYFVGMGWLYGLAARSAIARGRRWQAVIMLDGLRDQIVALACIRHGRNPHHGREVDKLPIEVLDALTMARARTTDDNELRRANKASIAALLHEVAHHDQVLARRLANPAEVLARP